MPHAPRFLFFALIVLPLVFGPARADTPFSPAQEKAVEDMVRRLLVEKPEILVEAIQKLRDRQQQEEDARIAQAMAENRDLLERDPASPVVGNHEGDVTIVEFFDYNCGYCKKVMPALRDIMKADTKLRVVMKELPILGPSSVFAARAALAIWKANPGRYLDFHAAVMEARGQLTEEKIIDQAAKFGMKADALKQAMAEPWIDDALIRNQNLARGLGISGTPAFVVGDALIPGAIGREALEQLVAEARSGL